MHIQTLHIIIPFKLYFIIFLKIYNLVLYIDSLLISFIKIHYIIFLLQVMKCQATGTAA